MHIDGILPKVKVRMPFFNLAGVYRRTPSYTPIDALIGTLSHFTVLLSTPFREFNNESKPTKTTRAGAQRHPREALLNILSNLRRRPQQIGLCNLQLRQFAQTRQPEVLHEEICHAVEDRPAGRL